jgi:hypothetical protein
MRILINDRISYKITHREVTPEGFLRVPGHVARSGIQQYLASELGLDGDPMRIVGVYRPPEEVFSADSLASYLGADITLTHPDELVTAATYKQVTRGVALSQGTRDGDFVQCDLIIKDADTIKAIQVGTCELSAGYTADYVQVDGDGYEYEQRNIVINHIAIVDRARAGRQARIFDNQPGGKPMPVTIVLDSGRSIDVADAANAQVVADAFDRLNLALKTATTASEGAKATIDGLNEKVEKLTLASSDAEIAKRVAEIAKVQIVARKVVGDSFTCASVDTVEIMRAAMTVAKPQRNWSDKSADYVQCAFDSAAEEAEESKEDDDKSKEQLNKLSKDAAAYIENKDAAPVVVSRAQAALNLRSKGAK